jgi:hypothetical protein
MDATAFAELARHTTGVTRVTDDGRAVTITGTEEALDKLAETAAPSERHEGRAVYVIGYRGAWSGRLPSQGPRLRG